MTGFKPAPSGFGAIGTLHFVPILTVFESDKERSITRHGGLSKYYEGILVLQLFGYFSKVTPLKPWNSKFVLTRLSIVCRFCRRKKSFCL